jgi:hypothetical protein
MKAHRGWQGSHNPFLSSTERSYILSNILFLYHDSVLFQEQSDPDILSMYSYFNPLQVDFGSKHTLFTSAIAARISANSAVRVLLKAVSGVNPHCKIRFIIV